MKATVKENKSFVSEFPSNNEDLFPAELPRTLYDQAISRLKRFNLLYPFLNSVVLDKIEDGQSNKPILVIISLNEFNTELMTFGLMDTTLLKSSQAEGKPSLNFPGSLDFTEDLDAFYHMGQYIGDQTKSNYPSFDLAPNNTLQMSWNIDKRTLKNIITYVDDKEVLTAGLPPLFKIMILYDIKKLPFESNNPTKFYSSLFDSAWFSGQTSKGINSKSNLYSASKIKMCYNNSETNCGYYEIKLIKNTSFQEDVDRSMPPVPYCSAAVFECTIQAP